MKLRTLLVSCCIAGMSGVGFAAEQYQQNIFIGDTNANVIHVIDVATQEVIQEIQVPFPHGMAATRDGKFVWAAIGWMTEGESAVAKIDTVTGQIVETHKMPGVDGLALANGDRDLYVPAYGFRACYYVFDTVEKRIVAQFETDGLPHNVTAAGDGSVYLAPMGRSVDAVRRNPGRS